MGGALTEALHGIRAEDLAGSLGPEVVTGNVLTVAPTEHQPVAVFFLLDSTFSWGSALCFYSPPLCKPAGVGAARSLPAHSPGPTRDPRLLRWDPGSSGESQLPPSRCRPPSLG